MDLDVFFERSFDFVWRMLGGINWAPGSPCLLSVGGGEWFDDYEEKLYQWLRDRGAFERQHNYTGNSFRLSVGSDQDFIALLRKNGYLRMSNDPSALSSYCIMQNPLFPPSRSDRKPLSFSNLDGYDIIGGREVLFWHLQNDFCNYVARYLEVEKSKNDWIGPYTEFRLGLPFIKLNPSAESYAFHFVRSLVHDRFRDDAVAGRISLKEVMSLSGRRPGESFLRAAAARRFVVRREGRGLFTDARWWKPGVFE